LPNGLRYEVIKNMNERDDINRGSGGRYRPCKTKLFCPLPDSAYE